MNVTHLWKNEGVAPLLELLYMKPFSCQLTNEINLIRILGVHGHVHPILFIFTLYKLGFRIEALGFDLAPKLCFDNLLKIIMIIIANIFLIAIIKFIIYILVIIFSISESKL